ncbi:MAG: GTPase Era [Clostridia bacterium]|nr:GTPase Era [Clostridia bacterium]
MKSGAVAVVGRANAGKSTLINVIVGEKVSIVSPKPQTTRDRILAVYNEDDCQIVFQDTPGVYKASTLLSERMQKATDNASKEVDLILLLIDAHEGLKEDDKNLVARFAGRKIPMIIAFTKTDIMQESTLISAIGELGQLPENVSDVTAICSRTGKNVKKLLTLIKEKLPDGEPLISEDIISDKSEKFMISEIMREKMLLKYDKEIPHGVAIVINEFARRENGSYYVNLDIVCEKQNHKAIIIGKQGKAIKETAGFAREGMEKFLGAKVFLEVYVKVKEDWRDRPDRLKEFGYSEDDLK